MVQVPLSSLSEWRVFPSKPCLAGGKKIMKIGVSMLLKSHASHYCFPSSPVTRNDLQFVREKAALSNDTFD